MPKPPPSHEDVRRADDGSLRELLMNAPAALCILRGPEHRFEVANETYRRLVGGRELDGRTVREAFPELGGQGFFELLDHVYASGEAFEGTEMPVRLDGPDGTLDDAYFTFVYQPLRNGNGVIDGVAIYANDVTGFVSARVELDAALRREQQLRAAAEESESKFRALFDAMPQLGWFARPDGYIEFYNRGWYEYTGTTPEQMEGWGWRSVHDPELLPAVEQRWRHSIETGTTFELTFPLRRHDGVFRWFLTRVNPQRDEAGRIIRWVGINTDVDDQRRSEQQLAVVLAEEKAARLRSEELAAENERLYGAAREQTQVHVQLNQALREALDAGSREAAERVRAERETSRQREELYSLWMQVPIPICVLAGEDLVYELANPAYLEYLGDREVVGRPLVAAVPEAREQGYEELLREVMRTGEPFVHTEAPATIERNGTRHEAYFSLIFSAIRNADGIADRVLAVMNDVTDQVTARQRVEALVSELATEKKRLEAVLAQVRKLG